MSFISRARNINLEDESDLSIQNETPPMNQEVVVPDEQMPQEPIPEEQNEVPLSPEKEKARNILLNPENTEKKQNFISKARYQSPPPSEQEEKGVNWFLENLAPPAVNLLEHVVEWPGRMRNFLTNTILGIYENASTDFKFPELGFKTALGVLPGFFQEKQREAPEGLKDFLEVDKPGYFPQPGEIRKKVTGPAFKALTGDDQFLDPKKGSTTEFLTEVGKNLIDLYSPGSGYSRLSTRAMQAVGGEAAKEIAKGLNAEEKTQENVKMLTMMGLNLMNEANGNQYVSQGYGNMERMVPQGATLDTAPITHEINYVRNQPWFRGERTPTKAPAIASLENIEETMANAQRQGRLDVQLVMQLRKDIVEKQKAVGKYDFPGDRNQASFYLDQVDRGLDRALDNYGRTVNPGFIDQYRQYKQAAAVTSQSGKMANFIQSRVPKQLKSNLGKLAFGAALIKGSLAFPATAGIALTAAGMGQGVRVLYRIQQSPVLANYYTEVLRNAAQGNSAALIRSINKFDEEALKQEKKRPPLKY